MMNGFEMTTAAPRLGTTPTLAERIDRLEHQLAEAMARIAALESARDADDQTDGPAPEALSSSWRPIKAAAEQVGYTESGLRAARRRHAAGPEWWQYRAGRLLVNVDTCPKKRTRT
jgi:hypothetical protein